MNAYSLDAARRAAGAGILAIDEMAAGRAHNASAQCVRVVIMQLRDSRWVFVYSTTLLSRLPTRERN